MIVVVAASGVGAFFASLWTGSETLQWIGSASVFVISLIIAIRHRRRRRRANRQD
jgi:membrane protein implicated in regulation of membrane protease activity